MLFRSKVNRARSKLHEYVKHHTEVNTEYLFSQLQDHEMAADEQLPETGIGISLERQLSPVFIKTDNYGTRSSTVILITHDNEVTFVERTYNSGSFKSEENFSFQINKSC